MIDFTGNSAQTMLFCKQNESFFENDQESTNYLLPEPLGNPYFLKVPTSTALRTIVWSALRVVHPSP
jgi:hypothetical protein